MSADVEAGLGPKQIARIGQWLVGVPLVYTFSIALLGVDWPNPLHSFVASFTHSDKLAYWVLGIITFMLEVSDRAMMKGEGEYEARIHEIIKGIGDRLRAGAAVETAVSQACTTAEGPSEVFEDAITLCDEMPFEDALRAAADRCGSAYLREVVYLVAEAVTSGGDTGGAVRRLGMELERNHQYESMIYTKIANPIFVLRTVGLFAVPPLFAMLSFSFNKSIGSNAGNDPSAVLFFAYGAIGITIFDGLIFNQWDRLMARLPLAVGAVYLGLTWLQ